MLCCFAGAVFGTLRYVYNQAAERSVHYLAWVLCFWSLGVATAVVICVLRPWPWMQDSAACLAALVAIWALLQGGAKACADLHKDCKDHLGGQLSVLSRVCLDQGILLAVEFMSLAFINWWSVVLDATVGAWVVCLAVHGKLPPSLP
jgi:hypothetical protein